MICNNHSTRCDSKVLLESVSKLCKEEISTGSLEIGESVTIKMKSRLWKAVIVNCDRRPAQLRRGKPRHPKRTQVSPSDNNRNGFRVAYCFLCTILNVCTRTSLPCSVNHGAEIFLNVLFHRLALVAFEVC